MEGEFLTKGLEKDRYLKAVKLSKEFEKEVYKVIRDVFDNFVKKQKNLFAKDVSPDERNRPTRYNATLATLRIDYKLTRDETLGDDNPSNKSLSVGLEMVDEGKQYQDMDSDIDSSLSYVYYKIKNDDEQNFMKVKSQTEDPNINFGEDMWNNAPGIFYIPVNDGEEFKEGLQILQEHFSKFGDQFR